VREMVGRNIVLPFSSRIAVIRDRLRRSPDLAAPNGALSIDPMRFLLMQRQPPGHRMAQARCCRTSRELSMGADERRMHETHDLILHATSIVVDGRRFAVTCYVRRCP
jgi:hypothetical protein